MFERKLMEEYFDRLWPICRSITGNGFRKSLEILREVCPYEVEEVPSGSKALDWTVPKEWNIDDAWIEDESGRRVVDFRKNNLHVLGYSIPIDEWMDLEALKKHLHSLPDQPNAIPYHTSYYQERWGFCITHEQLQSLKPGKYRAVIKSSLENGHLTYGHLLLPSTQGNKEEVLLSTYLCHPSMANNELSGPLVSAFVYRALSQMKERRYNYRFVIVPETIGAITYLSKYGETLKERCIAGFVLTCCGDDKRITYKASRRGNALTDRISLNVLRNHGKPFEHIEFFPSGSDERQYCSPGYNLPVGLLMRSMYGKYAEYHTSLDDKSFISFSGMEETVALYLRILHSIEENRFYRSTVPYGEAMLSPRGLYPTLSTKNSSDHLDANKILWIMNYSDGEHDLCAIADKMKCSVLDLAPTARRLQEKGLLK